MSVGRTLGQRINYNLKNDTGKIGAGFATAVIVIGVAVGVVAALGIAVNLAVLGVIAALAIIPLLCSVYCIFRHTAEPIEPQSLSKDETTRVVTVVQHCQQSQVEEPQASIESDHADEEAFKEEILWRTYL